jgi:beta-glucanase (GH16 family)
MTESIEMRNNMKQATILLGLLGYAACAIAEPVTAISPLLPIRQDNSGWELVSDLSDEFNGEAIDTIKWNDDPGSWGTWSWDKRNVALRDGSLSIQMVYEPHKRGAEQLFYKSGIIRSHKQITFGYFEARVKGASKFPGVCPAFWIKGNQGRESSEVDFMEIQEVQGNVRQIDCNLHAQRMVDGKLTWIRERRHWIAPWDPRDDYHIYGCEVTPQSIKWFIDGKPVLEAANPHWNLPMNVILSLGLRTPLRTHEGSAGEGKVTRANPKTSTAEGFPTEMLVDHVRVWKRAETPANSTKSK